MHRLRIRQLLVNAGAMATVGTLALNVSPAAAAPQPKQDKAAVDINVCIALGGGQQSCFPALSAGFELTNTGSAHTGGGGGAGKAVFGDVSIVKSMDASSPKLFLWTANGKHLREVTITITPKNQVPGTIKLTDVQITKFQPQASLQSGVAGETVNFDYAQVCISSGTTTPQCWNLAQNSPP